MIKIRAVMATTMTLIIIIVAIGLPNRDGGNTKNNNIIRLMIYAAACHLAYINRREQNLIETSRKRRSLFFRIVTLAFFLKI